jgi:hypothetical protein
VLDVSAPAGEVECMDLITLRERGMALDLIAKHHRLVDPG